ncbi:MAG: hypothetical protein K5683_10460 [Prevotella sp.]|nr:hypothetical protein [Prevotella sp.]
MTVIIRAFLFSLLTIISIGTANAGSLDDIRRTLEESSTSQVQEKVYVHTDNQCYFVGDTLWYKAYVVRADDLHPTDMSRLLYVELLSPDGMLVERQTLIVSPTGYTCGQFALTDSLYSGYYELRAYTRWMLNFNVRHHSYRRDETWWFYNRQMAADYFRIWDGLYSRVLPVYSKPDEAGDYDSRRMYQRPKTRLPRVKKEDLLVSFYPEGGHLIENVPNRVAFEITDQHGQAVNISGTIALDNDKSLTINTEYMGRGSFIVTPTGKRLKASFRWNDKNWTESLPKSEEQGATFRLDGDQLHINSVGLPIDKEYAVSILCRGVLKYFQQVDLNPSATISLPLDKLPSGVADVTLFDSDGQILADRLFFVNHHENDDALITAPIVANKTYDPYERIEMPIQLEGVSEPMNFSLSIRDTYTDEPTYDNGNLMTDLLLSSELRGFIAYPAHYFESDDALHKRHLDLLMMVQGWRKYNWQELADSTREMRYTPEKTMTVEGSVYKMLSLSPVEPDEVSSWQDGVGMVNTKSAISEDMTDPWAETSEGDGTLVSNSQDIGNDISTDVSTIEYGNLADANTSLGVNHKGIRNEVLVEVEMSLGDVFVGSVQRTENGRFIFEVPPFYGSSYLNMKAYKENDSIKKNMSSRRDATVLNEDAFPDYYVKRDLFYPIYTHDYTYYEKHQPEYTEEMLIDTLSDLSMENDVHQLGNINVQGRRRGRRAIDWKKPAFVIDAYDLYNDITDRGLSFGKLDMRQFPVQVCKYLFGNMNRPISFNVDGRLEGHTYYRNYSPLISGGEAEEAGLFRANRTSQYVYKRLKLKRLQNVRVFTDFEPRTEDSLMVYETHSPDATVDLELIPYDGEQPTFRDRHILFRGINMAEQFYQPDYSEQQPAEPNDYRRTLYWNPNAVCDEQGRFTAVFYNNSKETRIRMTAAGITSDGRLMHSK